MLEKNQPLGFDPEKRQVPGSSRASQGKEKGK